MPKQINYYLVELPDKKIVYRSYDAKIALLQGVRKAQIDPSSYLRYDPSKWQRPVELEDFGFNHPSGLTRKGEIIGTLQIDTEHHKGSWWLVRVYEGSDQYEYVD